MLKNYDPTNKLTMEKEKEVLSKLLQLKNVLDRDKFEGLNRKVQLKPLKWDVDQNTGKEVVTHALFVLKWGGELTHAGVQQA